MYILLVEDDDSIREILKMVLEIEAPFPDLKIDTATNGDEAVEQVKRQTPDLILLDLTLPMAHGFDVFRNIKQLDSARSTPVIALTAHTQKELEEEAIALGFAGYVTKPIEFDQTLFPLLKKLLNKKCSTQAA